MRRPRAIDQLVGDESMVGAQVLACLLAHRPNHFLGGSCAPKAPAGKARLRASCSGWKSLKRRTIDQELGPRVMRRV